jgi:hypothetical protein
MLSLAGALNWDKLSIACDVRFWHKADKTSVRQCPLLGGKADIDRRRSDACFYPIPEGERPLLL